MTTIIRKLIGVVQVAGGFWGLFELLGRAVQVRQPVWLVLLLAGSALFFMTLQAGIWLILGDERGVRWSRWLQLMQIPILGTPWLSYGWHAGAVAAVGFAPDGHWSFGYRVPDTTWQLYVGGPSHWFVGLDILAIVFFLLLQITRR